jgi:hypothetical protein
MFINIDSGAIPEREFDLFVSYNGADRERVEELVRALEKRALKVWFDRRSLIPGVPWQAQLGEAIKASKAVLVFLGSRGLNPWEQAEYTAVLAHLAEYPSLRIIPALGPGADPNQLPLLFRQFSYVDLRDAFPDKLDDVVMRVIIPATTAGPARAFSPRIFLCHAQEDAARVEELYFALGKAGLDPWYDKSKLLVGDRWEDEIIQAIATSDFFAICLSEKAVKKTGFIQKEIRTAISEFKRRPQDDTFLLPIRLEPGKIPRIKLDENTFLSDFQWIDVFERDVQAVQNLINAIWKQWNKKRQSE